MADGALANLDIKLSADIADLDAKFKNASEIADREMKRVIKAVESTGKAGDQTRAALERLTRQLQQPSDTGLKNATKAANDSAHAMHEFSFKTAAAKRELVVLAHELSQGNYSKFGGSMLVLAEQTGAAGMLFSAAGISALALGAAIATAAAAAIKGAEAQREMNNALLMTGSYSGQTSDSLNQLAHDAVKSGGSLSEAKQAVIALAGSGKFTAEQIGLVSKSVVALQHTTGMETEKAIALFDSLSAHASSSSSATSDAISKAALKIDDTYHYLNESVYEHIRALEKEGNQRGASTLAMKTFAEETEKRAKEAEASLSDVASAWEKIKRAASDALDSIGTHGKKSTAGIMVDTLTDSLNKKNARGLYDVQDHPFIGRFGAKLGMDRTNMLAELAKWQEKLNKETQDAIDLGKRTEAQSEASHAAERIASDDARLRKHEVNALNLALKAYYADLDKIRAVNKNSPLLDKDAIAAHVAALKKEHETEKPKDNPAAVNLAASIKEQDALIAQEHKQLQAREEFLKRSLFEQVITQRSFYEEKQGLIAEDYARVQEGYAKEIAEVNRYKSKLDPVTDKVKTAEANKHLVEIEGKRALAAQESAKEMVAATGSLLDIQNSFNRATDEWVRKEALANEQQQFSIDLMGKSTLEAAQLTNARRIYLDVEERIRQQLKKDPKSDTSALSDAAERQVKKTNELIAGAYEKQRDGWYGANEAMRKYGDSATNTGAAIENAMSNAFKGAEDALANFLMTGRLSFTNLIMSIESDLVHLASKSIINAVFGAGASGGGIVPLAGMLSTGIAGLAGGFGSFATMNAGVASANGLSIAELAGAFADGGDPPVGKVSLVGERGPELFVPKSAGTILPNEVLSGGGGTSVHYNPVIQIDSRTDQAQIYQMVSSAVQQGNANLVDKLQRAGRI